MNVTYEVPEPIICSPFDEPREHWYLEEGEAPDRRPGRRAAGYFYRDPHAPQAIEAGSTRGDWVPLKLVNLIRERIAAWRDQGWPGVTRTTLELLNYWRRDGRKHQLFFAQLEAAETIIFLTEARADFLQGIDVPRDEPSDDRRADGYAGFRRYACKMATGAGKTTVMGMLAAWSILNKINDRSDARFSDTVLVVCPNVTIRNRLHELDPQAADASLYRTRDLVPEHLLPDLSKGRVLVTNWHVFEPQGVQVCGTSARVAKAGRPVVVRESITIGPKTTTARNTRYLTPAELTRQVNVGLLTVLKEERDAQGNLKRVQVESTKYVESDTSLVNRVIGREVGGKQNILIFNDEAHHAYRIRRDEPGQDETDLFGEEEESEEFFKEATVWVDGLDRIHKLRGINFCVDLSATPYFLARVGQQTNRPFPWVVSDFGLVDAIESGLVKVPQLAVRDTSGEAVPGYFNIWRWILPQLTPAERGGRKGTVKPEAVLKYAHTPIAMLGGIWEELLREWEARHEPRPPVFILVCKNTKIAKVVYEWLAEDNAPTGIPAAHLEGFRNRDGRINTIRVDTKVVHETNSGNAKSDEFRWIRFQLDTVGKLDWPRDRQGRPIYPEGFEELAQKLERPLHPPGRDVRCIVSVGMLTEGWDCNTVTHIIGLRPFMSQLLCEQVVGRGLRRSDYKPDGEGRLSEQVAKVLGVPFEIIPFKQSEGGQAPPPQKRWHVHALPDRAELEIKFPRVEGYAQAIRNRVTVDWNAIATLRLDPMRIPPEVQMKAGLLTNQGRVSLLGPGRLEDVTLSPYRSRRRFQELVFEMARDLTRAYCDPETYQVPPHEQRTFKVPAHVLFPQLVTIVHRYLSEKVSPLAPADVLDVFLAPYYGWAIEMLQQRIAPDISQGEAPEIPRYEQSRGPGSTAEVDFWTGREPHPVVNSHVNYIVPDTAKWEQCAAHFIDTHRAVETFVKNAGLGFAIPYLYNGQMHDYIPDFIIRLRDQNGSPTPTVSAEATAGHLILETKGYDPLKEIKRDAAERWVAAVNADGRYGRWSYAVVERPEQVRACLDHLASALAGNG